eukprot:MONOS_644.2-p1 / transcript=MONOS_644.2 / gene=MONOS_644 / organism=Monocercomonoides_exilis_PA203 / gene_product=unspecified product / transcript_product=unspecified product / location=Mono_scaffold00010:249314-252516(+) / protein_length=949 / sequence_SO=supercontig / SO=protein_coding / is_pseudo=false
MSAAIQQMHEQMLARVEEMRQLQGDLLTNQQQLKKEQFTNETLMKERDEAIEFGEELRNRVNELTFAVNEKDAELKKLRELNEQLQKKIDELEILTDSLNKQLEHQQKLIEQWKADSKLTQSDIDKNNELRFKKFLENEQDLRRQLNAANETIRERDREIMQLKERLSREEKLRKELEEKLKPFRGVMGEGREVIEKAVYIIGKWKEMGKKPSEIEKLIEGYEERDSLREENRRLRADRDRERANVKREKERADRLKKELEEERRRKRESELMRQLDLKAEEISFLTERVMDHGMFDQVAPIENKIEPGETIMLIYVTEASLMESFFSSLSIGSGGAPTQSPLSYLQTFVIVDFFEFDSVKSNDIVGLKPRFDLCARYRVAVKPYFIHDILRHTASIELYAIAPPQTMGRTSGLPPTANGAALGLSFAPTRMVAKGVFSLAAFVESYEDIEQTVTLYRVQPKKKRSGVSSTLDTDSVEMTTEAVGTVNIRAQVLLPLQTAMPNLEQVVSKVESTDCDICKAAQNLPEGILQSLKKHASQSRAKHRTQMSSASAASSLPSSSPSLSPSSSPTPVPSSPATPSSRISSSNPFSSNSTSSKPPSHKNTSSSSSRRVTSASASASASSYSPFDEPSSPSQGPFSPSSPAHSSFTATAPTEGFPPSRASSIASARSSTQKLSRAPSAASVRSTASQHSKVASRSGSAAASVLQSERQSVASLKGASRSNTDDYLHSSADGGNIYDEGDSSPSPKGFMDTLQADEFATSEEEPASLDAVDATEEPAADDKLNEAHDEEDNWDEEHTKDDEQRDNDYLDELHSSNDDDADEEKQEDKTAAEEGEGEGEETKEEQEPEPQPEDSGNNFDETGEEGENTYQDDPFEDTAASEKEEQQVDENVEPSGEQEDAEKKDNEENYEDYGDDFEQTHDQTSEPENVQEGSDADEINNTDYEEF